MIHVGLHNSASEDRRVQKTGVACAISKQLKKYKDSE